MSIDTAPDSTRAMVTADAAGDDRRRQHRV